MPPEVLIEDVGGWLKKTLWNIDVAAALDDFTVDKGSNLGKRVVLGTVQLECLTGSCIVMEHTLKSGADIDRLKGQLRLHRLEVVAYVNRPGALQEVVGGEQVGRTGKPVQETVLKTEHGSWSDNGSLRENRACNFLTPSLQSSISV